jgi:putative hemolysin
MGIFTSRRYEARYATDARDLDAAQHLRHRAFRGPGEGRDVDDFDDHCCHVLIEDRISGALVGCFRLMSLADGRVVGQSYSAQFYDLSALSGYGRPMAELGRFCVDPRIHDADVLRVAWAALTRVVDAEGVTMLFGCTSFRGTHAEVYLDVFALLKQRHLAPKRWLPRVKAPAVFRFGQKLATRRPDPKAALKAMPPLLRSYLAMGGWVSDHAVVDRDLDTLHVFTGLEIGAIPPARARLLRGAVG